MAELLMKRAVVETTIATGPDEGFEVYGGCRVVLECGHRKQWDGGFPVPPPMLDDLIDCEECSR